jgi:hypothetical protein
MLDFRVRRSGPIQNIFDVQRCRVFELLGISHRGVFSGPLSMVPRRLLVRHQVAEDVKHSQFLSLATSFTGTFSFPIFTKTFITFSLLVSFSLQFP